MGCIPFRPHILDRVRRFGRNRRRVDACPGVKPAARDLHFGLYEQWREQLYPQISLTAEKKSQTQKKIPQQMDKAKAKSPSKNPAKSPRVKRKVSSLKTKPKSPRRSPRKPNTLKSKSPGRSRSPKKARTANKSTVNPKRLKYLPEENKFKGRIPRNREGKALNAYVLKYLDSIVFYDPLSRAALVYDADKRDLDGPIEYKISHSVAGIEHAYFLQYVDGETVESPLPLNDEGLPFILGKKDTPVFKTKDNFYLFYSAPGMAALPNLPFDNSGENSEGSLN